MSRFSAMMSTLSAEMSWSVIEKGDLPAAKLTILANDIAAAQKLAAQVAQSATGKQDTTQTETASMKKLIGLLTSVQKRARQKYKAKNPLLLNDYAIGEKWYNSRPILERTAASILAKLAKDTLPAIDAAKIAEIQKARDEYKPVQTDQTGGQTDASTDRARLEAAVKDIAARRREIQFAADDQWPHTDKANAGIRAEFKLPVDRALK
ncbi:MAG: hypothetical protein HY674_22180 [Chloroflexi bacterium]|nr:hypothetical protein [Chloroflexota bacterium]